jgi:hypothetical protein
MTGKNTSGLEAVRAVNGKLNIFSPGKGSWETHETGGDMKKTRMLGLALSVCFILSVTASDCDKLFVQTFSKAVEEACLDWDTFKKSFDLEISSKYVLLVTFTQTKKPLSLMRATKFVFYTRKFYTIKNLILTPT